MTRTELIKAKLLKVLEFNQKELDASIDNRRIEFILKFDSGGRLICLYRTEAEYK